MLGKPGRHSPPQLRTEQRFGATTSITSPPEGSHPCAGPLDERSWSHDTHSLARTEMSDVMRREHPRPCADRRGDDRDVLGLGKLARPFTVRWCRPIWTESAQRNSSKSGKASGSLEPRFRRTSPTAASGRTRRSRVQLAENQNGVPGARAGSSRDAEEQ